MASEVKVLRAAEAEDPARAPLLCDGERDSESLDCLSTTAATAEGSKQTPGEGAGADGEALSSSQANANAELEELRHLQMQQRQGLSMTSRPLATCKFFFLALLEQVGAACRYVAGSRTLYGSLLAVLWVVSILVALDYPSVSVAHALLSYLSFTSWWLILGILSSIGLGTGLQTFLLYLGPHIARFTLKATACGRSDLKSAPYDTALWGASDSWSARSCSELGPPVYPHFPGRHGGYYAVPLLHLLLAMLPEAMLWGAGTAIGELPPFFVARAARLAGERAKELDELVEGELGEEGEEGEGGRREGIRRLRRRSGELQGPQAQGQEQEAGGPRGEGAQGGGGWLQRFYGGWLQRFYGVWLQRFYGRAKRWLVSQGQDFNFFTIVFLAAIPNPLFDLAGLTCGHFLVPGWKFFVATLLGKCLVKAPSQAVVVAVLFNAHSIEVLEDALDALSKKQLQFLGPTVLPWLTRALDAARLRMAQGRPMASKPGASGGFSLSAVWSTFVVLMFVGFLGSIMTSTARAHLLHQQQHKMRLLQERIKQRQSAARDPTQPQGQGLAAGAGAPRGAQGVCPGQGQGQGQGEGLAPGAEGAVYQDAAEGWMGAPGGSRPGVEEVEDEVLGH